MQKGDNRQMALILKQYKFKNGDINFPAIFSGVPTKDRLPALYEKDFFQATALVVGALTMAFKKMRLKKMDGELINDIAEDILNTCDEDNLSMEDLVLFLGNMIRGKYGNIEEISVSKFMKLFDEFRDERHHSMMNYRENEHLQFKGLGDASRSTKSDPLAEHFSSIGERIRELKDGLSEKKERETMIKADKFFEGK